MLIYVCSEHMLTKLFPLTMTILWLKYFANVSKAFNYQTCKLMLCFFRLRMVCSSPGRRVTVAAELCMMSLNICGFSEYNLLQITLLAARTSDVTSRFYQNLYVLILHILFLLL